MEEVLIKKWKCGRCGKLFDKKADCRLHEKYDHKCRECDHCFWLYGAEQTCELDVCRFKKKKETDGRKP